MKKKCLLIFSFLLVILAFVPSTLAQDSPQWHLPEGAKARLGKGRISEIAYSPDGRRLAVASSIGIWIYDAQTGKEIDLLVGHTGWVWNVVFSADGQTIASGDGDNMARLWNAETGELIHTLTGHTSVVRTVSFSPNGRTIASGSRDSTVRLWDVHTGRYIRTLTGHTDSVYSVSFSPDGNTIASGASDDTVRLWEVETGTLIHTFTGTVGWNRVAFSADGSTVASLSKENVLLWNVETGTLKNTLTGHTGSVMSVVFSPDGNTIASSSKDGTARLWDIETGTLKNTLTGHRSWVISISFSPDGSAFASGSFGMVRLWNAKTGTPIHTFAGDWGDTGMVAFSPDGSTIATQGPRGDVVRLWDIETGTLKNTFIVGTNGNSVAFSPDGKTIASGDGFLEGAVYLQDARTGTLIYTLTGHTDGINSVAFSPDGNTIASGSDDETVRLWDVKTGALIHTLTGHTGWINSVAFSPDGETIASGSRDDSIRFWNANTGTHIRTLTGHGYWVNSVAFSPDRETIASGGGLSNGAVYLRDARTGTRIYAFTGYQDPVYPLSDPNISVAFSPDGSTIATASSWDRTIYLLDAKTGTLNYTYIGHTDDIRSISFSPSGNTLASGSKDGTILLWELAPSTTSNATVSLSPASPQSPAVGEQLTFSLKIADAENVAGYQATVSYDTTAFRYVESANGDYLPSGAFFIPPVAEGDTVTLAASSLAGESDGDGTLATLTFEVIAVKASTVRLTDVLLTDSSGSSSVPQIENAEITEPPQLAEDVNRDGIVNIIDLTLVASNFGATGQNAADVNGDGVVNIIDLTLVAAVFGNTASAPEIWSFHLESIPARSDVEAWLREARRTNLSDPAFQRGILVLAQLLAALTPKETVLLPNYPNPFNPETWIPYQLAAPTDVSISIYAADGKLVRTLVLGHQLVGIYESRSHAAHWDGKNALNEPVASGVYFYTLTAGEFTATRKMLIRK